MSIINDKLKNNGKPFAKTDNDSGTLTLGDLRKFIKDCDELKLSDEVSLVFNISNYESLEDIVNIEGDELSIIFYNW